MRDRFLKLFGAAAAIVAASATLVAQAPQTAPAAGAGRQGAQQAAAAPQSPTFARIQARTYEFKEGAVTATLPYEVYVPTKYDKSKPTPLIVALHGLGSNPTALIRYGGLTDLAEERGYIVVAPMGFNTGGWYNKPGPGTCAHRRRPRRSDRCAREPRRGSVREGRDERPGDDEERVQRRQVEGDGPIGHSMGGGGTGYLGMKYKDTWAALAMAAPAI